MGAQATSRTVTHVTTVTVDGVVERVCPLPYSRYCDWEPRTIEVTYTNHHDGKGWAADGRVDGVFLRKDGTTGRRVTKYITWIRYPDPDPRWVLDFVAANMPTTTEVPSGQ